MYDKKNYGKDFKEINPSSNEVVAQNSCLTGKISLHFPLWHFSWDICPGYNYLTTNPVTYLTSNLILKPKLILLASSLCLSSQGECLGGLISKRNYRIHWSGCKVYTVWLVSPPAGKQWSGEVWKCVPGGSWLMHYSSLPCIHPYMSWN